MTNKMPVVGQRYLSTRTGWECELKRFNEETATAYDKYGTRLECVATRFWDYFEELPEDNLQETEEVPVVASKDFMEGYNAGWNDFGFKKDYRFKESTDNEPKGNKTPNPVDFEKGEVNEKAKNLVTALKAEKANTKTGWKETKGNKLSWDEFRDKHGEPQAEDMSKPEPKIDIKEECVDPINIWKDVSELPKICGTVLVKWKNLTGIQMAYFYAGDESFYTDSNCANEDEFVKQNIEKCCLLTDFINSFEQMQKDIEELKRK